MDAQENILGSLNLFQAAARAQAEKIIFASTGGAMYGDQAPVPAREEDRAQPECPYGIAKLAVEHYLHFYQREHGIIPVRLRYANVYGPRQNGLGEAGVVAIFIEKFLAGEQPVINGDGLQTRDFTYVGDIVAANLRALDYPREGIFNIGTGRETDILTVYLELQKTPRLQPWSGARTGQTGGAAPQRPGQHPGPGDPGLGARRQPGRGPGPHCCGLSGAAELICLPHLGPCHIFPHLFWPAI